ncbi:LysM peptidoglycan-binding domain-containing protein [Mycobacterium sp. MYCO198283]|uniref:LysM peptidoglycan-binding domain-containing protein n=1 Tax=Mycobacterium sp. MYCO198283 TaxID=2883505 RepID=UPI001E563F4B|nr:LysM peptidoglycan-binding domain-containing protein [Mycobacterium sp. MYCO198283]MCG5433870.1 LysM peptidoglycan-binding domain-containing protein [Mycobacterium sp. MYCO198283]
MTILDAKPRPVRIPARDEAPGTARPVRRPAQRRPGGEPLRHRGPGVARSRAPHRRRPVTPVTTVALGLMAAALTVWLAVVGQFGQAAERPTAPAPDQLAVVQVQPGETLYHLAARVAPDAPAAQVADRIRDLNELDSAVLRPGQTLIAPIG